VTRALPLTRGDCVDGPRPCQHARCRHHIEGADESCSLDVADRGGLTQGEVGAVLGGMSKQLVSLIELSALAKMAKRLGGEGGWRTLYRQLGARGALRLVGAADF
jgi:hypothetical protein